MRTLPLSVAVLLAIAGCTGGPTPAPTIEGVAEVRSDAARAAAKPATDAAVQAVVNSDRQFALDLYALLAADAEGNLFFSPYSISTALSMAYAGAQGNTAAQLASALHVSSDTDQPAWHDGRNSVELALDAERPVASGWAPLKLEPTNAIFGQRDLKFEAEYLRTLAADYGAGLQGVDFSTQSEAARELINRWVKARTAERIPELLPAGAVDSSTLAVLVNAIYFKANWINQFNAQATSDQPFFRLDGSQVGAAQMRAGLMTGYAAGAGWQAVRLPYAGDASMLVILPDSGQFETVEADLRDVLSAVQPTSAEVQLSLPKWESKSAIDLKPPLQAAGITDLFEAGLANLNGVANGSGLFVQTAIHQANISVDEEGTEAAAATALGIAGSAAPSKVVVMTVDRPFIYLISDDVTGEVLFVGRVLDPTAG
jgi:serine protease inhibitor